MTTLFRRYLLLAPVLLATAAGAPAQTEGLAAPAELEDGWRVGAPGDAGLDASALVALKQAILEGEYPNTHSLLVASGGVLVVEEYFEGVDWRLRERIGHVVFDRDTLHDLRSATKSVTSTLVGISLGDEASEALSSPIVEFFPELREDLQPGAEKVTLHHVLTMTAGFEWNEMTVPYRDYGCDATRLYGERDPASMVLSRPLRDSPGEVWYYNGGLSQLLACLVERREGVKLDEYADRVFFGPLGITDYEWSEPGRWEGTPDAKAGLRLRPRDLTKIGAVFAHGGRWNGRQVVPEAWVEVASERHVAENGPWSRSGTYGYGYQWWHRRFTVGDRAFTAFAGVGKGDQRVFVVRELDLVVTVFCGNYDTYLHANGERLLQEIVAARIAGEGNGR